MLLYWVIFGRIVKVSTNVIPPLAFYLSGIICWNFFSDCLSGTMYTFIQNSAVFSKVWFPRLLIPISVLLAQGVRMLVQLVLFFFLYGFFYLRGAAPAPGVGWLLLPVVVLWIGLFGLGVGLLLSVLTAKYRDLDYSLQFILRLWMFASPVFYPAQLLSGKYGFLLWLNPMTPLIEGFRAFCFRQQVDHAGYFWVSGGAVVLVLVMGIAFFKRHEVSINDIV